MNEDSPQSGTFRPRELEVLYALSQAVAGAVDLEATLEQIAYLVRSVFIYDSIVLYEPRTDQVLEPVYARAIGRGRFREADLAWGEAISQEAYQTGQNVIRVEVISGDNSDRTDNRHSLGMPLKIRDRRIGAVVFIRFGGPPYTNDQTRLAEFIAVHIAQLVEHRHLAERIANLEARRKLEGLQDDFIATVSHELITPLGFIKGYATTLLREDIEWDNQTRREFLSIIDEEADRLHELIDNLMDSSRLQAGTLPMSFQPVRLDTLLKDISQRTRSLHEHLSIEVVIHAQALHVQADPTRLVQVFDNILNNAIKYAPDSPITITLDQAEQTTCVAIQDKGPGIAPEHLENIFQRFYRVPQQGTLTRGTGLGLYICRKIIQAHGGHITAESTVGQGTTFYIYLPILDQNGT
jgi:K+-sensing histidine kinase KdpD